MYSPTPTRSVRKNAAVFNLNMLRSTLPVSTWLALGAVLQLGLFALPLRRIYTVAPAVVLILLQASSTALSLYGLKRNTQMDGVIGERFTAMYPQRTDDAEQAAATAKQTVCVLLLGVRSNQ